VHTVTIATGRVETLRLSSGLHPGAATWSPDGKRMLVEVRDTVAGSGLVSVALDGSDERVIIPSTHSFNDWIRDGVYSPDGKRIAFAKLQQGVSAIWVANADGSDAHALPHDETFFDLRPAWSPSGRLIAYSHNYNCRCSRSGYDIYVSTLGDAPPWPVTTGLAWGGTQPSW
jgi:Tol biopolymer transport system component